MPSSRKRTPAKSSAKRATKKRVAKKSAPVAATKRAPAKRTKSAPATPLARLRELCLAFPEAHEVEAWGAATFRVKNKIFAMHSEAATHHGDGREGIWINSDHTTQDMLIRARPDRYFRPPYVGPSGWVGAYLDAAPDWTEIAELLRDGYRRRAPKKIAALLEDD
jgi:hypothetical protein